MKTLRVDFNRRRNGRLISSLTRASGPIVVGEIVEIYQPGEDDMTSRATVAAISSDGLVQLSPVNETVRINDVAARFIGGLPSWYRGTQTSAIASQPSGFYYPVNATMQSWRNSVPATA